MVEADKSYNDLKNDFIYEMDFIANIGTKMFLFPFTNRTKVSTYGYYFTYSLVIFTSIQLSVTLCLTGFADWFEIINIAPNLGVCLMILVKYGKINRNRDLYNAISQHFRLDVWEAISESKEHKRILNQYTQTTRYIVRFAFYYTIVLVAIVVLFPRLIMLYETDIIGKEMQYLYPFDGWYPFDKVQWYYIAYVWESFMTSVIIFLYLFGNMLHMTFTRHICMELKILGETMENLLSEDDVTKINGNLKIDLDNIHYNIRKKIKFIISKHQFLARITSGLDTVMGDGMLLTYVFGSVFICLTAFTATVVDDLYKSLRYFSFFCSLLVETFFQCIMGQLLINHSEKLERAIYFADWVYADSDTKNMLLILLMRSQKPFSYSANGYLTMNLDTFSGICSLSYQFFNLLRTAYSE
ncbi:odorant receptor 4-like [Anticarsia gemmatalis]|uniref:odorant receptor 4-like n=1 Tax=Anticarsia gemmatalis TaxID=129554 RepID=UPI003F76B6BB